MLNITAMKCATGAAWPALSVMTHTADVLTAVLRQKNVRPSIDLLSPSLQPAVLFRERFEFNVIANQDKEVDVLWVSLSVQIDPSRLT